MFVVYRIYHKDSNKSYVGKCINGLDRVHQHFRHYKNPNLEYRAKGLYRAMNKHGESSFLHEILEECVDLDSLNKAEDKWILKLDTMNPSKGYNLRRGGEGGDTFSARSKEEQEVTRMRISRANKIAYESNDERRQISSNTMRVMRNDPEKSRKNSEVSSKRMESLNKDPNFRQVIEQKRREAKHAKIMSGRLLEEKPSAYITFNKKKHFYVFQMQYDVFGYIKPKGFKTFEEAVRYRNDVLKGFGVSIPEHALQ